MANLQNELAQVQHISGELHTNAHAKIGMVVGRFNSFVVESLVSGAIDTLLRHGIAGQHYGRACTGCLGNSTGGCPYGTNR